VNAVHPAGPAVEGAEAPEAFASDDEIDAVAFSETPIDPAGAPAGTPAAPRGANGDGDPGQPRRRRRRGRRGRGRGGAVAEAAANDDGGSPSSAGGALSGSDDEPVVPRGVVAHELMPAATGGRGRRRGHRGGRVRRMGIGGEPVDPQLISPSNPVPRPGFDEE